VKIGQHGLYEFRAAALRVQVFVAKDQLAAMLGCTLRGGPEGASVAEMEQACGRGSEAATVTSGISE